MSKTLIALALTSFIGTALACDGEKCDKAECQKSHETASNTSAALPDGPKATLAVSGMKCGACADKVTAALMQVDGVKGAHVDPASGKAEVAFDDQKTNLDALLAAVNKTGFVASLPAAPATTVTQ